MQTYTTTATVKNHQVIIRLPDDFNAETVQVNITAQSAQPATMSLAEKLALVKQLSGSCDSTAVVDNESMRRENLYGDDGR